jgi:ABC-type uncharacterized transport system permease subunit
MPRPLLALCHHGAHWAWALFVLLGKDPVRGLQVFFWEPLQKQLRPGRADALKATPLLLDCAGFGRVLSLECVEHWRRGAVRHRCAMAAAGVALMGRARTRARWIVGAHACWPGVLGGMAWAGVTALLRDRFNANEILVSLMLVYVATLFTQLLGVWAPGKTRHGLQLSANAHL